MQTLYVALAALLRLNWRADTASTSSNRWVDGVCVLVGGIWSFFLLIRLYSPFKNGVTVKRGDLRVDFTADRVRPGARVAVKSGVTPRRKWWVGG